MLFSVISIADAEMWELFVDLSVQNQIVSSGDTVIVLGNIVDHANNPIEGVEVLIRTGSDTTKAFTDETGSFRTELREFQRIPGIYEVSVVASLDGLTGLSSTQIHVRGEPSKVLELQEKLSTEEARKYLGTDKEDFEKDPIGQTLSKYYHELLDELVEEKNKARKAIAEQLQEEEEREIAKELRDQAIRKFSHSTGTYEGYSYDHYIMGLEPKIRELVTTQLNFTKNTFEEGQKIRDEIIVNGGTYQEARQAYLEFISIPKEVLEQFNQNKLEEQNNE